MAKGASNKAQDLQGYEGSQAEQYGKAKAGDRNALFPFLAGEVNNPQGFGSEALNQMLTQGGESVSGATGAGNEAASLLASRTGNAAAAPGIIASNARNAMRQQSNNTLGINIQNAMLKNQQQQTGAKGLEGLYSEDVGAALKSMGLENDTLGEWTKADQASQDAKMGWFDRFSKLGESAVTAGLGGGG